MATITECYIGESLKVGLEDVRDTTGAFVTSLGGGESMAYSLVDEQDNSISTGSLTYESGTNATWRAFPTFPSTPGRVEVRITATIDSAVRKFLHRVKVKDFT